MTSASDRRILRALAVACGRPRGSYGGKTFYIPGPDLPGYSGGTTIRTTTARKLREAGLIDQALQLTDAGRAIASGEEVQSDG